MGFAFMCEFFFVELFVETALNMLDSQINYVNNTHCCITVQHI